MTAHTMRQHFTMCRLTHLENDLDPCTLELFGKRHPILRAASTTHQAWQRRQKNIYYKTVYTT